MDTKKVIVELGAGTGAFRDRFLPGALTTDVRVAEGIDILADATQLPFKRESVDEFVANNPYRYGFKPLGAGPEFLEEVMPVLKPGGRLVIRAHRQNPFAKEERIRQVVSQLGLTVTVREIDAQREFPNHLFRKTYSKSSLSENIRRCNRSQS